VIAAKPTQVQRFVGLRAFFVTATLKRSPDLSHTDGLARTRVTCASTVFRPRDPGGGPRNRHQGVARHD
jgi:hypothetical protein